MNIIVAGAGRGIGFEVVKKFALSGDHRIIALSRNTGKLEILAGEAAHLNPGAKVHPLSFDLEKDDLRNDFRDLVKRHFDRVDVLIYNAGHLVNKKFKDLRDEDFDRSFDVNVKGAFRIIRELVPLFGTNAHILTISSMGGFQGSAKFPGLSLYSASKGALAVLTECLAEEFRDIQVKCNCLSLGAVQTEMLSAAFPGYQAPLEPGEMADFIADFALHGHRFFNGKILPVSLSTP